MKPPCDQRPHRELQMNSTHPMPTTPLQTTPPHAHSTQHTAESRQRSGFTSTMLYSWHYFTGLLRRPETLVFCLILPAALYLMFGTATENSSSVLKSGNVSAFIMTGMGLYGSAIAMTSISVARHRLVRRGGTGNSTSLGSQRPNPWPGQLSPWSLSLPFPSW